MKNSEFVSSPCFLSMRILTDGAPLFTFAASVADYMQLLVKWWETINSTDSVGRCLDRPRTPVAITSTTTIARHQHTEHTVCLKSKENCLGRSVHGSVTVWDMSWHGTHSIYFLPRTKSRVHEYYDECRCCCCCIFNKRKVTWMKWYNMSIRRVTIIKYSITIVHFDMAVANAMPPKHHPKRQQKWHMRWAGVYINTIKGGTNLQLYIIIFFFSLRVCHLKALKEPACVCVCIRQPCVYVIIHWFWLLFTIIV